MIRSWRVAHFKSFKEPPELALSAINVIAGANSSGKSTVIQSILLLKQTLQYGAANRPVTLNGPLLRLGSFEDVRNFDSLGDAITIVLDLDITSDELKRSGTQSWIRQIRRFGIGSEVGTPSGIRLEVSFNKDDDPELYTPIPSKASLAPQLVAGNLQVRRKNVDGETVTAFQRYSIVHPSSFEENPAYGSYKVSFDNESHRELVSKKPESIIQGGGVSHFLPSWSVVRYNESAYNAGKMAASIFSDSFLTVSDIDENEELPDVVRDALNKWLVKSELDPFAASSALTIGLARKIFAPLTSGFHLHLTGLLSGKPNKSATRLELSELQDEVLRILLMNVDDVHYDFDLETPKAISSATEFLKEFIKSGIRYLGPLRDSPRPVYQPEALESTTDVGYRGEHTAAVLDLNGNSMVTLYLPPDEDAPDDYYLVAKLRRMRLNDAVKVWLQYLGVASDVQTSDAGVYGNRLQVKTNDSDRPHDLTNVGVGVSQVLPLIVMALLAKPGSFLIFEQPELHLHPKVQARLADFFIALAKDGKQTLLETHSEYLVDRLRLRIALAKDGQTNALINILFSKKIGQESSLIPVEVNEYGAINNWPEDFFEQSHRDVSRILKAAAARRKFMRGASDATDIH